MPEQRLAKLLDELHEAGGGPLVEAIEAEHELLAKERKLNAVTRRKLLRIVYAMVVAVLGLGIVSVVQQFQNGDRAEENAKAIAAIQSNRVQLTYDTCQRQNTRLADALDAIEKSQSDPQAVAFGKIVARALGLTDMQYQAYVATNLKTTTDLVAKITLDEPIVQTPDGPRRDCEQAIVDRFDDAALLADLDPAARARVNAMLRN